jgi:hypothetical protein
MTTTRDNVINTKNQGRSQMGKTIEKTRRVDDHKKGQCDQQKNEGRSWIVRTTRVDKIVMGTTWNVGGDCKQ